MFLLNTMGGALRIRDLKDEPIVILCWECQRIAVCSRFELARVYGLDALAPDVLGQMASRRCNKAFADTHNLHDRCKAFFYKGPP